MPRSARPGIALDDGHIRGQDGTDEADDEQHLSTERSGWITRTAFDAYFIQASASAQTSSHVFSDLVSPLSQEEYSSAIRSAKSYAKTLHPSAWSNGSRDLLFSQFGLELDEGFNLIFYGFGSKRATLNQFASEYCSKRGHVVIANAFQPDFTLKDLVACIERIPGICSAPLISPGIDGLIRRITNFFIHAPGRERLYLILHNVDAPAFRAPRVKSVLSLLAANPKIHLVTSVDHLSAPLLWPSYESATRKSDSSSSESHGFAWLWHDMTTLASYDVELSCADRSSLSGASTIYTSAARKLRESGGVSMGLGGANMTETAALHILASVTQRAKKLFTLIATQQLENMEESSELANDPQQSSFSYDALFIAARDNFIATNDTALKALLGEFRDHGLIVNVQRPTSGGQSVWIPLRKERLKSVLAHINKE